MCLSLTGCGGPPKDVSRKILLQYLEKEGVLLEDIKFVSSYAKDGGYTVNLMAGQATCEMPMLKVDGKWIAKGMSCSGGYFTPEQAKDRSKKLMIKTVQDEISKLMKTLPKTADNGVITTKVTFDASSNTVSYFATSPAKAAEYTETVAKERNEVYKQAMCDGSSSRSMLDNGISFAIVQTSSDGKPLAQLTATLGDCSKQKNIIPGAPQI